MQSRYSRPVILDARGHWTLDPDIVQLNHGSFGACPAVVLAEQERWRRELERQPTGFYVGLECELDRVKERLGELVGAARDDLALIPNTTTGVNAVMRSLRLEPGDEILITDHGYNACNNAAEFAAARAGATVVRARLPFPIASPDQAVDAVVGAVTARTRIALIDHITSVTALVLPIERIAGELADRGVDLMVDGAHAPGMVGLDMQRLTAAGVTYYAGNLHKWMCAPKGAAFLHVRRDRQETVRPTVISHGANASRTDRSRFCLEFDWPGTFDPTCFLALPAAIDLLGSLAPGGLEALMDRNRRLALEGRALLADALGLELPCPDEMIGSMASFRLPDDTGAAPDFYVPIAALHQILLERHRIQALAFSWPQWPSRVLRFSAHAYNTIADIQALATAVAAELGRDR